MFESKAVALVAVGSSTCRVQQVTFVCFDHETPVYLDVQIVYHFVRVKFHILTGHQNMFIVIISLEDMKVV